VSGDLGPLDFCQTLRMNDDERYAAELARMDRAMKAGGTGVNRPVFGKAAQPTPQPVQQTTVLSPRVTGHKGSGTSRFSSPLCYFV
jgi:hypothetical protein